MPLAPTTAMRVRLCKGRMLAITSLKEVVGEMTPRLRPPYPEPSMPLTEGRLTFDHSGGTCRDGRGLAGGGAGGSGGECGGASSDACGMAGGAPLTCIHGPRVHAYAEVHGTSRHMHRLTAPGCVDGNVR